MKTLRTADGKLNLNLNDSLLFSFPITTYPPLEWGCTTGNAVTVAHSTKKPTSGNDSVIEEQPLLLFM
jgi:hypothetical protein